MSHDFDWNSSYSVGHPLLDEQHRLLFRLCKQASDCADGRLGSENFHEVLNDLAKFALTHIQSEEAVLKKCNYAGLEAQEQEHHEFLVKIMDFADLAMVSTVDRVAFADYAWAWWRNHVSVSDMQFRSAVMQLGRSI
jgi:hemerythrin